MNLKQALKILRERGGFKITKGPKPKTWLRTFDCCPDEPDEMTDREVISWARCWTSDNKQTHKSLAKKFRNRKNRAAERNAIASNDFDSLPQGKGRKALTKDDDIWNWD